MKLLPLFLAFAITFASITSCAALVFAAEKPNVLIITADDLSADSLGSFGCKLADTSPNLDRLASEGVRFVNYYGQASCTAGRASFITGRIPIRTSLSAVLAPGDPNGLTKQTPTIAQYLK